MVALIWLISQRQKIAVKEDINHPIVNQDSISIFHPTTLEIACQIAAHYLAYREKIDFSTIQGASRCTTREDFKDVWSVYLQPTEKHPQYRAYVNQEDPFSMLFVAHYAVSKKAGVLIDNQEPGDFFIEEKGVFRKLRPDEIEQFREIEG